MGVSGVSTHMMRGEVGAPQNSWLPSPPIKRGVRAPSPHTLVVISLSLHPLLHLLVIRLVKPSPLSFSTTPRRRAVGVPGDPLLPLPRWIEGTEVVIKLYV